jgi:hypothetical protein
MDLYIVKHGKINYPLHHVLKGNIQRAFQLQGLIASGYNELRWHGERLILVKPVDVLKVCNILILVC